MMVSIVNVSDGPGRTPTEVAVYSKILSPGERLALPAELVNSKVRSLEKAGLIAIGEPPSWYSDFKNNKSKALSTEEIKKKLAPKKPIEAPEVKPDKALKAVLKAEKPAEEPVEEVREEPRTESSEEPSITPLVRRRQKG